MNDTLISKIKRLTEEGARPSIVLRQILDHKKCDRFSLIAELREHFKLDVETAIETRRWNYWDGKGYDDTKLDELLKGKLTLKENASSAEHRRQPIQ
jgi:hypothetical protein